MNEIKWHDTKEFPPHDTKDVSKTVIVRKKSGRTLLAYYSYAEKKWMLKRNGKSIKAQDLVAWRPESTSFFALAQQREDEEQAAYLAEWSRRHRKCK